VKSSQREFEAAAVQAVSQWKFTPGRKRGSNVNTHMQVPIVFSLPKTDGTAPTPAPKN
jgi:periplasmic protein TonB